MPIEKEQSEQIKKQLLTQIENSQLENKEQIKEYIQKLNPEQLKEFLKQNKIQPQQQSESKCIFCSIVDNEVSSYRISENKKAIAILEINPLSKGHAIIIPVQHTSIEKIPKSALSLAQNITKKIKTKLKPEEVKIETSSFQGHAIINIIPFYKDAKIEKRKASEEELKELQSLLETKKRQRLKTTPTARSTKGLPKISFRIP